MEVIFQHSCMVADLEVLVNMAPLSFIFSTAALLWVAIMSIFLLSSRRCFKRKVTYLMKLSP